MAKAYICDKCGEVFSENDIFYKHDKEGILHHSHPMTIRCKNDLDALEGERVIDELHFCGKCARKIRKAIW